MKRYRLVPEKSNRAAVLLALCLMPGLLPAQDADNDGMPDAWEVQYGLDTNSSADALFDPDGDFLSNLQEYQAGTIPTNRDTDADSLPDGYELAAGLNPVDALVPLYAFSQEGQLPLDGSCEQVVVSGGYAWLACGSGGLQIVDVSVPSSPQSAGGYPVGFPQEVRGLDVVSNMAFLATWGQDNGRWITHMDIVNAADPTNCSLIGRFTQERRWLARSVAVAGNMAYLGLTGITGWITSLLPYGKIALVDISNPADPLEAGAYQSLHWAHRVDVQENEVLAADGEGGIAVYNKVVETNGPAGWYRVEDYEGGEYAARDLTVSSNLLLAAYGLAGFQVIDFSDPETPDRIGMHGTDGEALGIAVQSNLAFVSTAAGVVHLFDIENPQYPTEVGSWGVTGPPGSLALEGLTGYAAAGTNGLVVFSLSDDDSDMDGMSDGWELGWFGSLTNNASDDTDGDGISDIGEYRAGLNPLAGDQDGDMMPDGWEVSMLLDPTTHDAGGDPDEDGAANVEEYIAGTHPQDGASIFRLAALAKEDGDSWVLTWPSVSGRLYRLFYSTNILNGFLPVSTNLSAVPPSNTFTGTAAEVNGYFHLEAEIE